jgi:hypothetical protein
MCQICAKNLSKSIENGINSSKPSFNQNSLFANVKLNQQFAEIMKMKLKNVLTERGYHNLLMQFEINKFIMFFVKWREYAE